MRNEFLNEIGDSIFAIAMAAAIGLAATNLAIQITHERAALDAASFGHENELDDDQRRCKARHESGRLNRISGVGQMHVRWLCQAPMTGAGARKVGVVPASMFHDDGDNLFAFWINQHHFAFHNPGVKRRGLRKHQVPRKETLRPP